MTKTSGGDGEPASAEDGEVPPTRKSTAQVDAELAEEEAKPRPSAMEILHGPDAYPDDGPFAGKLRKVDHYAGLFEQVALFVVFGCVVFAGAAQAVSTKLLGKSLLWSFDIVRAGTFMIALVGAAFASHQMRHLSMDVVSRFVSPRKRLALRVMLGLFTIFAALLLFRSGMRLYELVGAEGGHQGAIPMDLVALMIPLGAGLIIFHTLLRILIDADYLRRGKLPPEKAPTGH